MSSAEDKILELRSFIDGQTRALNNALHELKSERAKLREATDPELRRERVDQIDILQGVIQKARGAVEFAQQQMNRIEAARMTLSTDTAVREASPTIEREAATPAERDLNEYGAAKRRDRGLGRELADLLERDVSMGRDRSDER